jgi:hypothetical protein
MLAHVGKNHAVLRQTAEEFVEEANGRLRQAARIEFRALGPASDGAPLREVRQCVTAKFCVESRNGVGQVSDYRQIARAHSIELSRINFEVNDLGVRGES